MTIGGREFQVTNHFVTWCVWTTYWEMEQPMTAVTKWT